MSKSNFFAKISSQLPELMSQSSLLRMVGRATLGRPTSNGGMPATNIAGGVYDNRPRFLQRVYQNLGQLSILIETVRFSEGHDGGRWLKVQWHVAKH